MSVWRRPEHESTGSTRHERLCASAAAAACYTTRRTQRCPLLSTVFNTVGALLLLSCHKSGQRLLCRWGIFFSSLFFFCDCTCSPPLRTTVPILLSLSLSLARSLSRSLSLSLSHSLSLSLSLSLSRVPVLGKIWSWVVKIGLDRERSRRAILELSRACCAELNGSLHTERQRNNRQEREEARQAGRQGRARQEEGSGEERRGGYRPQTVHQPSCYPTSPLACAAALAPSTQPPHSW